MQVFIFKNKNKLMFINMILIIIAFGFKFIFNNNNMFNIFLIIASIIGSIPIITLAYSSLRLKIVSIDVLVSIAIIAAFIIKNYEESSIVSFLFLFGSYLEAKTLDKTRNAIKDLVNLKPKTAYKQINGKFELVDISEVLVGDIIRVNTGDLIPVDGMLIKGDGYVDESSITGEPLAVHKNEDSLVFQGSIVDNGSLIVKATKVKGDTTFSKIIELVEEAQDSQSKTLTFINEFSKYYTPLVLVIALVVYLFTKNIELSVTILVLGCPGALVIGVPVSNVSGIGNGARNGVLFKGSNQINNLSKTDTLIFDKTGTLTEGKPLVNYEYYYSENKKDILSYLVSIESLSTHPLAKAILNKYNNSKILDVKNFQTINGFGLKGIVNNNNILIGNYNLMIKENVLITNDVLNNIKSLEEKQSSIVLMAINKKLVLLLGITDEIRKSAYENILEYKKLGINNIILLSGDSQEVVDYVVKELNLTKGIGSMLPEDKANYVQSLKDKGNKVTFIGDGINDSPSIALADVGISMGSGTDVAIETSDLVLINSDLNHLTHGIKLSRSIVRNMISNIVIALSVVALLIIGLIFSDLVDMKVGMLIHELSILVVILNGMRLLRFNNKRKRKEKI